MMLCRCIFLALVSSAFVLENVALGASDLPLVFFHGATMTFEAGNNFEANLTAEAAQWRRCRSVAAPEAVREVVANNSAFDDGYIFIGHSQGGLIARGVIEEMDDYKVKRFISLAGLQNAATVFNYGPEDYYGKMQKDFVLYSVENPGVQGLHSHFNCVYDQHCRKSNFLKVEQAHFFASSADTVIKPWQNSLFGRYSEVDTIEEIQTKFMNLTMVDMKDTIEYTSDTFGLRTMDERGGLFLREIANVTHLCWVLDEGNCEWVTVYDQHIYPALV
ncbi:hypothetical protein PHYSODRAFT_259632 [Phytophthora sojae]|uniref:Uncharacterized protein n=1 Tax=Phytophthora sojae (strain P6497) TaxID=1094619 RepID=G4Z223_PHYSP|nr:hypothetical protein PHYSODRAFT_259632 [Phytophthora sojae]EGZ20714.1 hypothetical protein PHYSODRAFT_259632 [Phytophthora sojae]|eukprot:XP_009523431.1 hypothetical protein PHYSODRAFT_259632 [Phytophthora sojae]